MVVKVDYKEFEIEIDVTDDEDDNTIKVVMRWKEGHYNPETHYSHITDSWDSGEGERIEWVGNTLNKAIKYLENRYN